ncbi:MAG: cupin domain-containing protein [Pseudonocardiaceae bacterium]
MTGLDKVRRDDARTSRRQGGEIRILLSSITTGSTAGFLGTVDLAPGDYVSGHYHPYSDEFMYVVRGALLVETGEQRLKLGADEALMMPRETPHRFTNKGDEPAFVVFHIGPLAPSPELGHVETEPVPLPDDSPPSVGGNR